VLPDKGALGGLYTAVHSAAQTYALVIACDMPFVNLALLDHLRDLAPQSDAVVPRLDGEAEPFRAIYLFESLPGPDARRPRRRQDARDQFLR